MLAPIYSGEFYNEPLSIRIPVALGRELRYSTKEMLLHPGLPPKRTSDILTAAILVRPRIPFPMVINELKAQRLTVLPKPM